MPPLRITTWNVNGIRNPFGYQPWRENRTFEAMFDLLEADIVVLQELKIQRKDLRDDMVMVPGWDCFFSLPKHKKGYSGVAIYTRSCRCAPLRAEEGVLGVLCPPGSTTAYRDLPAATAIGGYPTAQQIEDAGGVDPMALDAEGRCVVLEFPAFVLLGVYSPANSNGLRDDFRLAFFAALDARVRNLVRAGKRVVLCGDLNVSRSPLDSANAEESMRKDDVSHDEYVSAGNRRIFNQMLENGNVVLPRDKERDEPVLWDACREFHPTRKGMFTHWEQKINARPANFGSRIDFVLCSITMKDWVQSADIQEGLMGSDHCPVYAILKDRVLVDGKDTHLSDLVNPPSMLQDGERLRDWTPRDSPALSGRLLPEFDGRRNIKDMFSQKAVIARPSGSLAECVDSSIDVAEACGMDKGHATINPMKKRPAPSHSNATLNKKPKLTQSSTVKGQGSLKGFFKPKATHRRCDGADILFNTTDSQSTTPANPVSDSAAESPDPRPFVDPIVSKESWDRLFTKPRPPRCEDHDEPCISLTTKKAGANCGRAFWMCPRPIGPSGAKEKSTEWRCRTFIWASEWSG